METTLRTQIDEDGHIVVRYLEVPLHDEKGNPNPELDNPLLVQPPEAPFYEPKWDFETLAWTEGAPEEALAGARKGKSNSVRVQCDEYISLGFSYNGDDFYFTLTDQNLFGLQLLMCVAFPEDNATVKWLTKNNGPKLFTREEFFAVCKAGNAHFRKHKDNLWAISGIINTLTDVDEINNLGDYQECLQLLETNEPTPEEPTEETPTEGEEPSADTTG